MKAYLVQTVLAALLFLLCIGAFNWWSDPFGMWRPVDVERLNRNSQGFFLRMSKPWQISRIKPSAAVIGSSRSGSINPQHAVWAGESSYNVALHGLTVYEMKRFIEHSQAQGTLKKLLIAIEFDTFTTTHPPVGLGYAEGRMLNPEAEGRDWSQWVQWLSDIRDTLFTSSTLAYSLQARFGKAPSGRAFQDDGSWRYASTRKGPKNTFEHAGMLLVKRSRKSTPRTISRNLSTLSEILVFCHRKNIDTRLYFSPEHLLLTDLRRHIGYNDERDNFLRQVIAINEEAGSSTGNPPFPVWGFNHLPDVVDHPLHEGDDISTDWFRDGFHFYSKLGDIIMEQVWGTSSNAGLPLDSESLDDYLARVENLRAQFVSDHKAKVLDFHREVLDRVPRDSRRK